jgi:hypothetical protein
VRYHSSGDTSYIKYFYHNLLISPGVTPIDGSNPGFAVYEVDNVSFDPHNLVLHFIPIEQTYGWKSIPSDISNIPFRKVALTQFGLNDLSPISLSAF